MSKVKTVAEDPDLLPEYDFSRAVRGKYHRRFRRSSNVVVLDPDVARAFPTSEAVNTALRAVAERVNRGSRKGPSARTKRPSNAMKLTKPAKR